MREILFRGKRTDNGEWVYGMLTLDDFITYEEPHIERAYCIKAIPNEKCECLYWVQVIPETIGQYTGLTDKNKNGNKIFEGDICKHRSNYSGEYIISVVTYINGQFLAMADNNSGFNLSDKLEVIGNIHDNPELLKGGAE